MRILMIESSPHKHGSSNLLAERFIEGAKEAGHQVETFDAARANLHPCLGCDACGMAGPCVQKDDMAALLEKMLAADVIVLATPVYFYSMSAQLKVFIDRCAPRYTEMRSKEFCFVLAAADSKRANMKRAVEALRGFTFCLEDPRERGIVYGLGAWEVGDVKAGPAMQEAYEMGRNL